MPLPCGRVCWGCVANSPRPAPEDPCLELYPGLRRRHSGAWRSLPRAFPRLEKEAFRGFLSSFAFSCFACHSLHLPIFVNNICVRLHTAVPYIGRKTLTDDQQEYNDVHGFYRARVEHLFARLWQWRIVRLSGHALQRSCTAMCVFCSTLLSFAFADRLGINRMDLGLMCQSLYGHRRRQPL